MSSSDDWIKTILSIEPKPTNSSALGSALSILGGSPENTIPLAPAPRGLSSLIAPPPPTRLSSPFTPLVPTRISPAISPFSPTGLSSLFAPSIPLAEPAKKWSVNYLSKIQERLKRRESSLQDRIDATNLGRVMPDLEQISIGSGKQMHLAILFLDICNFSGWPSGTHEEQTKVLKVMNIFMAEMLNIVRDYDGTFEKNTGDGLMAYFGATFADMSEAARTAVTAASVMFYVNDTLLTPWFKANGLWQVKFRVGIDVGEVTLGKVGIPHLAEQFVAIGTAANIACKIMKLLSGGGICVGDNVRNALPPDWRHSTSLLGDSGFVYKENNRIYNAWEVTHRLWRPTQLA